MNRKSRLDIFRLVILLCASLGVCAGCTSFSGRKRANSSLPEGQFTASLDPLSATEEERPTASLPGPFDSFVEPVQTAFEPTARFFSNAAKAIEPSHNREWRPNMAILPYAEFRDRTVLVRNIRNCEYETYDDYTVNYYDKAFELDKLQTLDVFVIPFAASPSLAHVAMSFGFEGGDYLGVSVEIRKEREETYDPVAGVLRQYELIYILGGEIHLGSQRLGPGASLFIAADQPYRFRAGAEGFAFINYRRDASEMTVRSTGANECTDDE